MEEKKWQNHSNNARKGIWFIVISIIIVITVDICLLTLYKKNQEKFKN